MAKQKSKARRGSDADSITSTTSNSSRTASQGPPASPHRNPANGGAHPKRKPSTSGLNKVSLFVLRIVSDLEAIVTGVAWFGVVDGRKAKESSEFQSSDVVDFYSVGRVLYDTGFGTYVFDCVGHGDSNHCVQGGHCAGQCSCSREEDSLFQSPKLVTSPPGCFRDGDWWCKVLFGYDNVLLVWREFDLLFQTHCLYRRILSLLCDSSSLHFLSIVSHGFVPLFDFY